MAYLRDEIFARLSTELEAHPTATLAGLSARLRVHRHTLTDIVRERTGVPFRAWRDQRLVDRTERLLRERGTRSIKEISHLAGFSSTRVFDRFVKRHTGCRPGDLRAGPSVHLFAKRSAEDR